MAAEDAAMCTMLLVCRTQKLIDVVQNLIDSGCTDVDILNIHLLDEWGFSREDSVQADLHTPTEFMNGLRRLLPRNEIPDT